MKIIDEYWSNDYKQYCLTIATNFGEFTGIATCSPEDIDYPIPGNDDAIRSVKLIATVMANAVIEGKQGEVLSLDEQMAETEETPSEPKKEEKKEKEEKKVEEVKEEPKKEEKAESEEE